MAEFRSKSPNLTLYMTHVLRQHDGNGNVVATTPSRRIRFEAGRYVTRDKAEIDFLRKHRFYGTRFVELDAVAPEQVPETSDAKMQREPDPDGGTGDDKILLPCDFEGCDYVAEDTDESNARRRLNAHKTRMGHHTED